MWEAGKEGGAEDVSAAGGLFGDAETRAFYEELPDLLSSVPLSVLGFTPEQVGEIMQKKKKRKKREENRK